MTLVACTATRTRTAAAVVAAVVVGVALLGVGGDAGASSGPSATEVALAASGSPMQAPQPPVVVASGIPYPQNLAFDAHGGLWVTSATVSETPSAGLWYVSNGGRVHHVRGLAGAGALAWNGGRLYLGVITKPGKGQIRVLQGFTGDGFAHSRVLLDNLALGAHLIGQIVAGPGGRLFLGLGALEDHSGPPGRVISFSPQGGAPAVAATGLRTAYGLAFWNSRLLVTVNGPDLAGVSADVVQAFTPSHRVVNFGFPKCYDQGGAACAGYPAPLASLASHSTPEGIVVKGDVAYVAVNGSSVPQYPVPSGIDSIDLRTGQVSVFWQSSVPHDNVGLALGPDGNLYASETVSGAVVRFSLS